MGNNLRPVGSEKLEGMAKIQRIMEIARYKENIPKPINEDKSTEYTKVLANGKTYKIDKEKSGYIIKCNLTESINDFDYLDPMKNRKYYSSYSQALKRLNLIAKEVNVNEGSEKNVNLFYESANEATKYILKMKGGETDEQVAPSQAPAPAPSPAPSPAPAPAPAPAPEDMPEPAPEDMDLGIDTEEDDNEEITLKSIQKLTGKLAQKLRAFQETEEGKQEMTSKDSKYVINSVLSALDLESIDDEDKEEIVNKIEGTEDEGMGDFNPDDMGGEEPDFGGEESPEALPSPEGEMAEERYASFGNMRRKDSKGDEYYDENNRKPKDSDLYGISGDDFDTEEFDTYQQLHSKYGDKQNWFGPNDGESMFNHYKNKTGKPFKVKTRREEMGEGFGYDDVDEDNPDDYDFDLSKFNLDTEDGNDNFKPRHPKHRSLNHPDIESKHAGRLEDMIEGIFSESKVDKIIEGYFKLDAKEQQLLESKKRQSKLISESKKVKITKIKQLSESISQEVGARKLMEKYPNAKLVGKTNKQNLVFEMNNKQLRVNTKGQII